MSKIALATKNEPSALVQSQSFMPVLFQYVAAALSGPIEPSSLAGIFDALKSWGANIDELTGLAKDKVRVLVHESGEQISDAGTRRMGAGDFVLEIRPSGGAPIVKRIEALCRAKGYDPATYMDAETVYRFNEEKFKKMKLTPEERESCFAERTYAVQSPKRRDE